MLLTLQGNGNSRTRRQLPPNPFLELMNRNTVHKHARQGVVDCEHKHLQCVRGPKGGGLVIAQHKRHRRYVQLHYSAALAERRRLVQPCADSAGVGSQPRRIIERLTKRVRRRWRDRW